MNRWLAALVVTLVPACGSGGLDPEGGGDDVVGAEPDAGAADPDAGAPELACEPPAFTTGVSTLGGCGVSGAADGPRGTGTFANPVNVLAGPDGEVIVADFDNDRVRVIDADGEVRTLVQLDGFAKPFGLALGADGAVYVQTDDNDAGEHSIETGTIWRVELDGGDPTVVARDLGRPRGLLALPDGRLVLSDYYHHDLRLLDPDTGAVTPLAGKRGTSGWIDATGVAARFEMPYGLALLPDGRVAVADLGNHRIRAVALDGTVSTLAGSGTAGDADGLAAVARFEHPQGLAIDAAGTLYITDTDNHVVRRLRDGAVTTVVGSGTAGWLDSAELRDAQLYGLEGLAVAEDGETLWIADGSRGEDVPYHRVRVVAL